MESRNTLQIREMDEHEFFEGESNATTQLKSIDDIINPSYSKSTLGNMDRSERLFIAFAKQKGSNDPVSVTWKSSQIVLNFLAEKCRYNTKNAMTVDTMGGYVQGLRLVYSKYGHRGNWVCDVGKKTASGNPLVNNDDLEKFRRAYRVNLSRYGNIKLRARPLTAEIACDHAEQFWFGTQNVKLQDIAFHSIVVLGLNLGLRYDEISKLRIEHVSIGRQSARLTLNTAIKNSTVERVYEITDWDGITPLHFSIYMDPFIALQSWVIVRGKDDGYLFPDILSTMAGCTLKYDKPLSCKSFVAIMRSRLLLLGIGSEDVEGYTGHSLKRGCVQLHRSLGYMDEAIMRKIGMVGPNAYANYCAAYNNYAPRELPRFNSWEHLVQHAEAIAGEAKWIHDVSAYEEFEREVFGVEFLP